MPQLRKSNLKMSPRKDRSNKRCHNCGRIGHFWRNCTVAKRALPQELQGASTGVKHYGNPSSQANKGDKIRGTILKSLTAQEGQTELTLGPKIESMVLVHGQEVKALIDTVIISIISLQCILQIWKDGRDSERPECE